MNVNSYAQVQDEFESMFEVIDEDLKKDAPKTNFGDVFEEMDKKEVEKKQAQNDSIVNEKSKEDVEAAVETIAIKDPEPTFSFRLIQPGLERGDKYVTVEKEINVKGEFSTNDNIKEVTVNGKPAKMFENGYFEVMVAVPYMDNTMKVRFFSEEGHYYEESFQTFRPLNKDVSDNELMRSGKDYALLFATNEFSEYSSLVNPIPDAKAISKELKQEYGYEVEVVTNPSLEEFFLKLREYAGKHYGNEDQLFIFFAGHGIFDDTFKEGFVVASDSKKSDPGKSSYVSHARLHTIINNIPCDHVLLMLDVCFGGTFDQKVAHRGSEEIYEAAEKDKYIRRKLQYNTRLYITSGGKEYVPDGRPGAHSPFTRKFLEALRNQGGSDGILTYREILVYIDQTKPEPRSGEFGDNEPGSDFLFIKK